MQATQLLLLLYTYEYMINKYQIDVDAASAFFAGEEEYGRRGRIIFAKNASIHTSNRNSHVKQYNLDHQGL